MELIFEIVFNSAMIGSRRCYPIGLAHPPSHLDLGAVKRRQTIM